MPSGRDELSKSARGQVNIPGAKKGTETEH